MRAARHHGVMQLGDAPLGAEPVEGQTSKPETSKRRGVFPGSFNPLTVAHLAIAEQARQHHQLDAIELVVSEVALDKPTPPGPSLTERISLIEADLADTPWLSARTTEHKLIADIAAGYDAVIMGVDKWVQVNDPSYYPTEADRDTAVASLPTVIVADRGGIEAPEDLRLKTNTAYHDVSSTAARNGNRSMMAPHAAEHWQDRAGGDE